MTKNTKENTEMGNIRYIVVAWARSSCPLVMAYCVSIRDARRFVKHQREVKTKLTIFKLTAGK